MLNIRPGRLLVAAAVGLLGAALGLSAPLVVHFDDNELKLSNVAVLAAPRDGHEITGPIDIIPALRVRLDRGTIALNRPSGARAEADADVLPTDGSAKLVIDGGVFRIAGSGSSGAAAPDGPAAPLIAAIRALNFEALVIRRSTVELVLPDGRIETLSDVTAEVLANRKSSVAVRGTGNLREQSVSFEMVSSPLIAEAGSRVPVKLRLKSRLLDVAFDGRVGASDVLQLQGRVDLAMKDVRQTARWLGAPWPSGPGLVNAGIKGDFDWQGQALTFDKATFRMDGNEATGTLALGLGGRRPTLTGTLALQSLDLSPYFPNNSNSQIANLLAWIPSDDESLAAPMSWHLDADIRASAARVLVGGMEFGRFAASLSFEQGQLLADIAEIGIDGGRASGQLTADFRRDGQPQLSVRGRLEDIEASRATSVLIGHSAVQGLSTITADVAAGGNTVPDLLSTLRGKVTLSLNEGGQLGIDVKSLLNAAQSGGVNGWEKAKSGQMSVDGLEAKLRFDKGIVASELVEATAGDSLIRAMGTISLRSQQMDLRVLLDAGPETARTDLPQEVLVFRGPWSAPSIMVER